MCSDLFYFLDFDLSILGASEWKIYDKYGAQIREEYSYMRMVKFIEGRCEFIKNALFVTENLYYTPLFRDKYQKHAVKNLQTELERIGVATASELNRLKKNKN